MKNVDLYSDQEINYVIGVFILPTLFSRFLTGTKSLNKTSKQFLGKKLGQ